MPKNKPTAIAKISDLQSATDSIAGVISEIDPSRFDNLNIVQVVSLKDGQQIEGTFRGPGDPVEVVNIKTVEVEDPETGEVKTEKREIESELSTWRLEVAPRKFADVLGSKGLDRKMRGPDAEPGKRVVIARLGLSTTRAGRQVGTYVVGWESE